MSFIFECIEAGSVDLSNQTISEALQLSRETVRRCKWRGFQRLRREAEKDGVKLEPTLEENVSNKKKTKRRRNKNGND
jgi:hypothetical protein